MAALNIGIYKKGKEILWDHVCGNHSLSADNAGLIFRLRLVFSDDGAMHCKPYGWTYPWKVHPK